MPSAGCAACCSWCREKARPPARSCCAVPNVPRRRRTPPGTGSTWAPATGTAATILRARATGRLRHTTQDLHGPGYLELQTTTRPGGLRAARRHDPRSPRTPSASRKPRPPKGLSRSWNPKWIRNPRWKQNQRPKWSRSPTRSRIMRMSRKIPEDQSVDWPLSTKTGQDLGLCLGWTDATEASSCPPPLEVNKPWRVHQGWALPSTLAFSPGTESAVCVRVG